MRLAPSPSSSAAVFSVYRSFRRELGLLPTNYLRQFYRIKLGIDVRAILQTPEDNRLRIVKLKRVKQELRKLISANLKDAKAFDHILDVAYGRKGRLRWELMKPFLSNPTAPVPDRIIPEVERSRPPNYSPEMVALLTSSQSRTQKGLHPRHLITPPTLPPRADPNSEQARLLGPFSKRREVNIRWRYFTKEWKRVHPPLQIRLAEWEDLGETNYMIDKDSLLRAGIRGAPMQNTGIMEQVIALAGPAHTQQPSTRRERLALGDLTGDLTDALPSDFETHLPQRFLRRRFRSLLSRLPILTYTYEKNSTEETRPRGKYEVSVAPASVSQRSRYMSSRFVEADETDIAWIQHAEKEDAEAEAIRKEVHAGERSSRRKLLEEARGNKLTRR